MLEYHCPECRTTNNLHEYECSFAEADRVDYEKAMVDILSVLSILTCSKDSLIQNCGEWSELHDACFQRLQTLGNIVKTSDGYYRLASPVERRHAARPNTDPLATIWEYGTVPGCHDNGLFALIAYFANQDFTWEETKNLLLDWFEETNTWDRGGFSEQSPKALIESKRHVHEEAYGWNNKGRAAKRIIDQHRGSAVCMSDEDNGPTQANA